MGFKRIISKTQKNSEFNSNTVGTHSNLEAYQTDSGMTEKKYKS